MKSIKENIENEIIIKKSKFITKLYRVDNIDKIDKILLDLKNKYNDSTHICYAYIVNNIKRFNDDNEPNGTAGMPILKVLENNLLENILCVVIRYFGGIKLGAGGLIRAYCNSTSEAINKAEIANLYPGKLIDISFIYDNLKKVDNILKDIKIIEKEFNECIKYKLEINDNIFLEIKNKLNDFCLSFDIIDNILVTI